MEIWKKVVGYEGLYEVSNIGRIKSYHIYTNGKILKPYTSKKGYHRVVLYNEHGVRKTYSLHRLIAKAFIGSNEKKTYINHKNGIKTDNRIENLEWVTNAENIRHAFDTGLKKAPIGENVHNSKLTEDDVKTINVLLHIGDSVLNIAKQFGVDRKAIYCLKYGETWKHVNVAYPW